MILLGDLRPTSRENALEGLVLGDFMFNVSFEAFSMEAMIASLQCVLLGVVQRLVADSAAFFLLFISINSLPKLIRSLFSDRDRLFQSGSSRTLLVHCRGMNPWTLWVFAMIPFAAVLHDHCRLVLPLLFYLLLNGMAHIAFVFPSAVSAVRALPF